MESRQRPRKGSRLEFRGPSDGMRAYLAVGGGIDVPLQVMGSRATYMKAAIGGIEGRSLRAGDILNAFPSDNSRACRVPSRGIPPEEDSPQLRQQSRTKRVVLGPQRHDAFTLKGIDTFLNSTYGSIHQLGPHGLPTRRRVYRARRRSGCYIRRHAAWARSKSRAMGSL